MIVNELAKPVGVEPHIVRYHTRIGLFRPVRHPRERLQAVSTHRHRLTRMRPAGARTGIRPDRNRNVSRLVELRGGSQQQTSRKIDSCKRVLTCQ